LYYKYIFFSIIKSINIKNSIISDINIIIFTIINSINIKNSIICVINTVERGVSLLCFLSRIAAGGVLPTLPKAIGSYLVAGPNAVGFGCQDRSKTLPKRANNIGSYCPARPKTLQNRVAFSCPTTPTDLGSGCATISKDIIICIINITNYFLLIFKILLFIFKILFFLL